MQLLRSRVSSQRTGSVIRAGSMGVASGCAKGASLNSFYSCAVAHWDSETRPRWLSLSKRHMCVTLGMTTGAHRRRASRKSCICGRLQSIQEWHTTPVRKAQRGQIQGKQEGMRASLVCARVEELTCGGVSVKICGFWFGTSEQHVRRHFARGGCLTNPSCRGRGLMPD